MKIAALVVALLPFLVAAAGAAEGPRNVVLIMADDLGIEGFGCYGGVDYQTPNIDKLAATGLRFTHAYSQPLCTPTRLEIMTGLENQRNWRCFGILPPDQKTFGHLMQGFGYATCIAGKWQLQSYDPPDFPGAAERRGIGMHPRDAAFDAYSLFHSLHTEDKGSRYANPTFLRNGKLHQAVEGKYGEDLSVDFLLDFMQEHRDERMFVYYPMALPHWPMTPTPLSLAWSDPSRRQEVSPAHFPDMVAYMDQLVGRLVQGIEKLGLREDTLILFYSDNGTDRRITSRFDGAKVQGGKATPQQSGIRVPLIANWPGRIPASVNSDLIEPSDFLPTLAALAGKQLPAAWRTDGVSFAPQLLGEKASPRSWAFFWYDPRPGWDKEKYGRSIFALDHQYKLFEDGRLYDIAGTTLRETPLDLQQLTPAQQAGRDKLQAVIRQMMQPPLSAAAQTEVNAFGEPVSQE
ncbi:sulfatase-like hydrolase/transferase [Lignipirellula cremea]|uniref:Arylsulfatase n=1 Tax=Lignipirellula cremea TaxID=2528010 RepID=A0A518DL83_9BACT|nr:sulfatase-like hydrolase/transferase [Lignipirellula cremea]QDU92597.1 Arylsulfatase [Lignipirellula cremea]